MSDKQRNNHIKNKSGNINMYFDRSVVVGLKAELLVLGRPAMELTPQVEPTSVYFLVH